MSDKDSASVYASLSMINQIETCLNFTNSCLTQLIWRYFSQKSLYSLRIGSFCVRTLSNAVVNRERWSRWRNDHGSGSNICRSNNGFTSGIWRTAVTLADLTPITTILKRNPQIHLRRHCRNVEKQIHELKSQNHSSVRRRLQDPLAFIIEIICKQKRFYKNICANMWISVQTFNKNTSLSIH